MILSHHPPDPRAAEIAALNDHFRTTGVGGQVFMHPRCQRARARGGHRGSARAFDAFTPDNDPYGEHDFGAFILQGRRFFFKIDYYDEKLAYRSQDPPIPARPTAS